jgi:hypothetical protein
MVYLPKEYVHGNKNIDRRNIMSAIIAEGRKYDFDYGSNGKWWTQARDYFTPTLNTLENGRIDKFVDNLWRRRIVDFIKI